MNNRHSIRLKGCDYSKSGCYFVTVDVQNKFRLFWGKNGINEIGIMIERCWLELKSRFEIELDEYVVMPDHFHGIVVIPGDRATIKVARTLNPKNVGAGFMPAQLNSARTLNPKNVGAGFMPAQSKLGEIVGAFKSISMGEYIDGVKNNGWPRFYKRLWQRDFYERIIRNELELNRIRGYIRNNPANYGE